MLSVLLGAALAYVGYDFHHRKLHLEFDAGTAIVLASHEFQLTTPDSDLGVILDKPAWQPMALPTSLGWQSEKFWIRVRLHNSTSSRAQAILEVQPSRLSRVQWHFQETTGRWTSLSNGAEVHGLRRAVKTPQIAFPVNLGPDEFLTGYLEIVSDTALNLTLKVSEPDQFLASSSQTSLEDTLLIGVLMGIAALAFGVALVQRSPAFVLLGARVFISGAWQLQQLGLLFLAVPAGWLIFMADSAFWLATSSAYATLFFLWAYLGAGGLRQSERVVLWVVTAWVSCLALLGSLSWRDAGQLTPYLLHTTWMILLVCTAVAVKQVLRGYWLALLAIVGVTSDLLMNAPLYLTALGFDSSSVVRQFTSPVPVMITSIVFFIAAALQQSAEKRQTQRALNVLKDAQLQELEGRVAERTMALRAASAQAQEANQAKSVFLAKVSHELRTPLNAVVGFVDLALKERPGTAIALRLQSARKAAQSLAQQISDLLDFARSERHQIALAMEATSLPALMDRVGSQAAMLCAHGDNQFELQAEPDLPVWVVADWKRLEQLMMILLSNAARYTRAGHVRLKVSAKPADEPLSRRICVEVIDTGVGISADHHGRIFEAFERADALHADGLGLGLTIGQQLCRLMGSEITVQSQAGHGSTFRFELSLRVTDEPDASSGSAADTRIGYGGPTRHVLLLDDNTHNLQFMEELLGDLGFVTYSASTLDEAQDLIARQPPLIDFFLLDQRLAQGKTSWDFVGLLRRHQHYGQHPILMLSATEAIRPADWKCERDIDGHIFKPIEVERLLDEMTRVAGIEWLHEWSERQPDGMPATDLIQKDAASTLADDPNAERVATLADWIALKNLCDHCDLSGLDEWLARFKSHEVMLQPLAERLAFEEIARIAARYASPVGDGRIILINRGSGAFDPHNAVERKTD